MDAQKHGTVDRTLRLTMTRISRGESNVYRPEINLIRWEIVADRVLKVIFFRIETTSEDLCISWRRSPCSLSFYSFAHPCRFSHQNFSRRLFFLLELKFLLGAFLSWPKSRGQRMPYLAYLERPSKNFIYFMAVLCVCCTVE